MSLPQPFEASVSVTLKTLDFKQDFEGQSVAFHFLPGDEPVFDFKGIEPDERGLQWMGKIVRVPAISEHVTVTVVVITRPRTGQITVHVNPGEEQRPVMLPDALSGDLVQMWPDGAQTSITFGVRGSLRRLKSQFPTNSPSP